MRTNQPDPLGQNNSLHPSHRLPQNWQQLSSHKWSVDEFCELRRQQLIGMETCVELVEGEMHLLPTDEQLLRQIALLQYQIQRHLDRTAGSRFEVRSHSPIPVDPYCELRPTLTIVECVAQGESTIHWVIDMTPEGVNRLHAERSQYFAQAGIADYWSIAVSSSELRIHDHPVATGYQQGRLLQTGERASPTAMPHICLCLQEPLPLHFLTRTLKGSQPYTTTALPIQVCSNLNSCILEHKHS